MAGLEQREYEYTSRDACWLLVATLICNGVILPLKIAYALAGIGNNVYLGIIICVAIANIAAIKLCKQKPQSAVQTFSWVMFVAIIGMLAMDAAVALDTFPAVANLLAIISIGTAYVVGLRRAILYIIANVIALAWLSALYGLSDTVPILAACTIGGALVGRLRDELQRNRHRADMTEEAIRTYARIKNGE